MSEWDIFKGLETVKAPPDFEQKVIAQLSFRKRMERRRRTVLRWSMAGSFASLAVIFVLLNIFVFQGRSPSALADRSQDMVPASSMMRFAGDERMLPIIETVDYRAEMRSRSSEPETIYLLEQISDTTPRGIRY